MITTISVSILVLIFSTIIILKKKSAALKTVKVSVRRK